MLLLLLLLHAPDHCGGDVCGCEVGEAVGSHGEGQGRVAGAHQQDPVSMADVACQPAAQMAHQGRLCVCSLRRGGEESINVVKSGYEL